MASEEPMTPVEYVINTLKVRFVELSVLVHHLRTSSNLCNVYEFRSSLLSPLCWRWDMFCLQLLNRKRMKEGNETRSQILKWKVTLPNGVIVEFVGVCKSPGVGRRWCGPEGDPLSFSPY